MQRQQAGRRRGDLLDDPARRPDRTTLRPRARSRGLEPLRLRNGQIPLVNVAEHQEYQPAYATLTIRDVPRRPPSHRDDFEEMFTALEVEISATFRGVTVILEAGR